MRILRAIFVLSIVTSMVCFCAGCNRDAGYRVRDKAAQPSVKQVKQKTARARPSRKIETPQKKVSFRILPNKKGQIVLKVFPEKITYEAVGADKKINEKLVAKPAKKEGVWVLRDPKKKTVLGKAIDRKTGFAIVSSSSDDLFVVQHDQKKGTLRIVQYEKPKSDTKNAKDEKSEGEDTAKSEEAKTEVAAKLTPVKTLIALMIKDANRVVLREAGKKESLGKVVFKSKTKQLVVKDAKGKIQYVSSPTELSLSHALMLSNPLPPEVGKIALLEAFRRGY